MMPLGVIAPLLCAICAAVQTTPSPLGVVDQTTTTNLLTSQLALRNAEDATYRQAGTNPTRSSKNCAALSNLQLFPLANICAGGRIVLSQGAWQCGQPIAWTDAMTACQNIGARLCSLDELASVPGALGCNLTNTRVWTGTSTGCTSAQAYSRAGSVTRCSPKTSSLTAVCCADVYAVNPVCLSNECSSVEDPGNSCVQQGPSSYTCACALAWKQSADGKSCQRRTCADGDPCRAQITSSNLCLPITPTTPILTSAATMTTTVAAPTAPSRAYSCNCSAPLFIPGASGSATCAPCTLPCLDDPCNTALEPLNQCMAGPVPPPMPGVPAAPAGCSGSYKCTCGNGWFASTDGLTCRTCTNPCTRDPCGQSRDPSNICLNNIAGVGPCDFRCQCLGQGYIAGATSKSCVAVSNCPNPCASDPCNSFSDVRNLCIPDTVLKGSATCPSYTCQCLATGYYLGPNSKSCGVCLDPCQGWVNGVASGSQDPCQSALGTQNVCVATFPPPSATASSTSSICAGTFTCVCATIGWTPSTNLQSCVRCLVNGPCSGDPCNGLGNPNNICVPGRASAAATCGTRTCQCNEPGWKASADSTSCIQCANPCDSDPCLSSQDANNQCVPFETPGSSRQGPRVTQYTGPNSVSADTCSVYSCVCSGNNYVAPLGAQSCIQCSDPCAPEVDPCNHETDSNNVCVTIPARGDNQCATYDCQCNADGGWVKPQLPATPTCQPCRNPCGTRDPCAHTFDPNNVCQPNSPVPTLPASFFISTLDMQSNPADPAFSVCPGYTCQCQGQGWLTPLGKQSCAPCPNPCVGADPCNHQFDSRNLCQQTALPAPGTASASQDQCGSFTCSCAVGWLPGPKSQSCTPCTDPCGSSGNDPCRAAYDVRNTCTPTIYIPNIPQLRTQTTPTTVVTGVTVSATSSTTTSSSSSIRRQYTSDPTNATALANALYQLSCGTYTCSCGATGWLQPSDKLSCQPCPDPCAVGDPCSNLQNQRNVCVANVIPAGLRGTTTSTTIRRQASYIIPPPYNPFGPFTIPTVTPSNSIQSKCGAYSCVCSATGWTVAPDGLSCIVCPNPCANDPCSNSVDSKNTCTPTLQLSPSDPNYALFNTGNGNCGGYICSCQGVGFLPGKNNQACLPCPDPCVSDPCTSRQNAQNVCIPDVAIPILPRSSTTGSAVGPQTSTYTSSAYPLYSSVGSSVLGPSLGGTAQSFPGGSASANAIQYPGDAAVLSLSQAAIEAVCGSYSCRCGAQGYIAGPSQQSCQQCPNPCYTNDPCSLNLDTRNKCIPDLPILRQQMAADTTITTYTTTTTSSSAIRRQYTSGATAALLQQQCGGYTCKCSAYDWLQPPDAQSCIPCPNPCTVGDPCSSQLDNNNYCQPLLGMPAYAPGGAVAPAGPLKLPAGWVQLSSGMYGPTTTTTTVSTTYGNAAITTGLLREATASATVSPQAVNQVISSFTPQQVQALLNAAVGQSTQSTQTTQTTQATQSQIPGRRQYNPNGVASGPTTLLYTGPNPDWSILTPDQVGTGMCGGYVCTCNKGWVIPKDRQSCDACPNPCLGIDPCKNKGDSRNVCVPDFQVGSANSLYTTGYRRQNTYTNIATSLQPGDIGLCGGYQCTCGSPAYVTPPDGQTCVACPDPCANDPCSSSSDSRNYCIAGYDASTTATSTSVVRRQAPRQVGPRPATTAPPTTPPPTVRLRAATIKATVKATKKVTPKTTAKPITTTKKPVVKTTAKPAASDEASLRAFPATTFTGLSSVTAVPLPSTTFQTSPTVIQNIVPRVTTNSITLPLGSTSTFSSSFPITTSATVPSVFSSIGPPPNYPNFQPPGTTYPAQPSDNNFGASAAYLASTRQLTYGPDGTPKYPASCSKFSCTCGGDGYIASTNGMSCVTCPDPCLSANDPCQLQFGPNNICVRTANTINVGYLANDPTRKCGGYSCQCGAGFITSANAKTCQACPNPCLSNDPCSQSKSPGNRCIPDINFGSIRRQAPPQNDDPTRRQTTALGSLATTSQLVFYQGAQCGGYTCQCAGALQGWITSSDTRTCIPCSNPCQTGDPCLSRVNPLNQCVPASISQLYGNGGTSAAANACGGFSCQCAAGYTQGSNGQSCKACPNPCSYGDPCGAQTDSNNQCVPLNPGQAPPPSALYGGSSISSVYGGLGLNSPLAGYGAYGAAGPYGNGINAYPAGVLAADPSAAALAAAMSGLGAYPGYGVPGYGVNGYGASPYGIAAYPGLLREAPVGSSAVVTPSQSSGPRATTVGPRPSPTTAVPGRRQYGTSAQYAPSLTSSCGTYYCVCDSNSYTPGPSARSCVAATTVRGCNNPCAQNPCKTLSNAGNICVNQPNVQCGYYTCQCATGWVSAQPVSTLGPTCQVSTTSTSSSSSSACPSTDPCLTTQNADNICSPLVSGGYMCSCASGWSGTTNQVCVSP